MEFLSGHLGLAMAPAWLAPGRILELGCARKGQSARETSREHVESAIRRVGRKSVGEADGANSVGRHGICATSRRSSSREHARATEMAAIAAKSQGWNSLRGAVEKIKAERWDTFRGSAWRLGKGLGALLGKRAYGIKLKELGAAAGGMDYMSVSAAVKRLEQRAGKDAALAAALQRCRKELQM